MRYIVIYLLGINIVGLLSMYVDKQKAKKQQYRISEKALFTIAVVGGSVGSIIGMNKFRHKTKHWYFKWGMPAILVLQVILVLVVIEGIYL